MTTTAVIVAGGSGARFGGPKHKKLLGGIELWQRSVDVFCAADVHGIVVVGDVPGGVPGGPRRRDSVACGLSAVPAGTEWAMIHDAARPLVTQDLIRRVLERLHQGDVDGVVPVLPVTDTLKRVDGESVLETIDRVALVSVQTPQAFRLSVLRDALANDQLDATDDAALVERNGGTVVSVMGDPKNIKITLPDDLSMARAYLAEGSDHA